MKSINEPKVNVEDCEGLEDMADYLYKDEYLKIFNIPEFDDKKINDVTTYVYSKMSHHEEFKQCMITAASKFVSEDEELGFMVLFSYNYFFITHRCICDFLETGEISEMNINALKTILQ
jgi:hypothetical protein